MSQSAERYRKIAGQFTDRVRNVPVGAWDDPAPWAGWVARDVVRHLVEWVPGFFESYVGISLPTPATVDTDPSGAWVTLSDGIQALLDDPVVAAREFDGPMGRMSVEQAVDMIVTSDVLLHTWDLARATGQDETLDPQEVHRMFESMEPLDDVLRNSGHYGPRVEVPDDADEQSKLIAFIGRRP
ncbi:MAG TPA: TIGR03086 family metal-binding protein [Acidimicrobiales bacterium]|nr:TIGR03086 family metal-binding protein [Acidimicrobiales bacterium]